MNYGVESNSGILERSPVHAIIKISWHGVYTHNSKPNIPFDSSFISFRQVDETAEGLIMPVSCLPIPILQDLSAYPYTHVLFSANGNTDPKLFPAGFFERFINLAPRQTAGFAETGYIAEDLVIPAYPDQGQCHPAKNILKWY